MIRMIEKEEVEIRETADEDGARIVVVVDC
jgi:hypothetical protein